MPDWTYHTIFRPLLFRLPAQVSHQLVLNSLGTLSKLPGGRQLIQFMGHTTPDPKLTFKKQGLSFTTRVGLGHLIDPKIQALPAFSEFGFGFIEIGPISIDSVSLPEQIRLNVEEESLSLTLSQSQRNLEEVEQKLANRNLPAPLIFAVLNANIKEEATLLIEKLSPKVDALVINYSQAEIFQAVIDQINQTNVRYLLSISVETWQDQDNKDQIVQRSLSQNCAGIVLSYQKQLAEIQLCKVAHEMKELVVTEIRQAIGKQKILIDGIGIHQPMDAISSLSAGSDVVRIDSGLVFAGPSFPKRINEADLYSKLPKESSSNIPIKLGQQAWLWGWLLGIGMIIGSILALVIALTNVVLPYDEAISGLTKADLIQINSRLLAFMTHDRVTLAGSMFAVGLLYASLAYFGIRRGLHWPYVTVLISAAVGFISFFSFLGFGYFDPFHAFVAAILFQFMIMLFHGELLQKTETDMPDLWNDWRFYLHQWGQLLFILHGITLIVAGSVILSIGMTTVFIAEDLEFMQTTLAELCGENPGLLPLVAHDRATFGGMLLCCGVTTALSALWGFRRNQWWLWLSLMIAGSFAYLSTIAVHWAVGYESLKHLLPAYGGFLSLWLAGILSYPYLMGSDMQLQSSWEKLLQSKY